MAKFKLIISDPKTGKSQVAELEGSKAVPFLGRRLGDIVNGSIVGLGANEVLITGGTDKDGIPMRSDVHGGVKTKIILAGKPGFNPQMEGTRKRKIVRGNLITEDTLQINLKIVNGEKKTGNV